MPRSFFKLLNDNKNVHLLIMQIYCLKQLNIHFKQAWWKNCTYYFRRYKNRVRNLKKLILIMRKVTEEKLEQSAGSRGNSFFPPKDIWFIWKAELGRDTMEKQRYSPSTDSLSKWLQCLGCGQAQTRSPGSFKQAWMLITIPCHSEECQ